MKLHLNDPKLNQLLEQNLFFDERSMTKRVVKKNGDVEWHFNIKKHGELPAVLKKVLHAEGLSWKEVSRFVAKEHCIYWEITPDSKLSKISWRGDLAVE